MTLGSCYILSNGNLRPLSAAEISIRGTQFGLIVKFHVTQVFINHMNEPISISYVFPNDLKMCIYDTTFYVGSDIIKPKLQYKEQAQLCFSEAVKKKETAIFGSNLDGGLTEYKLGNLPSQTECRVELKIAFSCQLIKENIMLIKFPFEVFTPEGIRKGLISSEFSFSLKCDNYQVLNVTSNYTSVFDKKSCTYFIRKGDTSVDGNMNIVLNIEFKDKFTNSGFSVGNDCVLFISNNINQPKNVNNEFIFVIDCSASMSGLSIKKARECLLIFLLSLPSECYFNIIRFGSRFEKLFPKSVKYDEETLHKSLEYAYDMDANLGGTDIYSPLENSFSEKKVSNSQRQFFIMTDGEVSNPEMILNLVEQNRKENRCFSIGIGKYADAGLVEGIAERSGGKYDFVSSVDSLSEKVIPQLESSLLPSLECLEIHFENNEDIEISPFPIPSISYNSAVPLFIHSSQQSIPRNVLVTGMIDEENIEIPISIEDLGHSDIKDTLLPLYAFNYIHKIEKIINISENDKNKVISLSILSGVLSKYTAFIGMSILYINEEKTHQTYSSDRAPCRYLGSGKCGGRYSTRCLGLTTSCRPLSKQGSTGSSYTTGNIEQEKYQEFSHMNLLMYQKCTGYWNDLSTINNIISTKIESLSDLNLDKSITEQILSQVKDEEIILSIISTLLSISFLRKNASGFRNSWMMIERKALSWLKNTIPDIDIELILKQIESLIPKKTDTKK